MNTTIKLAYRHIIDAQAASGFERNVFDDTFAELQLQAHVYNREGKFNTVAEIIAANPKANSLHYKIGFAIGLYVDTLGNKIPYLTDNLGASVPFDIFSTQIVHADLHDKLVYKMSITFITKPLTLVAAFGEYLVVGKENGDQTNEIETITLQLRPNLSVVQVASVEVLQEV